MFQNREQALTEYQRQNGIPIMRDGEYVNPKLPMTDAMSFVDLGQDLVRGAQGKNPNWLMDILNFGQQFLGPAPKEMAKVMLGRDEYGQPLIQNEGILGSDIAKGQVGGLINAGIEGLPGISTLTNAFMNEKKYQDSGGRKGNQYALENITPNLPVVSELTKLLANKLVPDSYEGYDPNRNLTTGSWMMSQSGQKIDQEKVSRDWRTNTDYEINDRFAAEEAEGGALPQGLEDYKTYAQTMLMSPATNMTQQIAQAKLRQFEQEISNIDTSGMDEITKKQLQNAILGEYQKLVKQFYQVDPSRSLAEQIPRYPLNAGLKGMSVSIPQQFENAMAGRSYNQSELSEWQRLKEEALLRQYYANGGK